MRTAKMLIGFAVLESLLCLAAPSPVAADCVVNLISCGQTVSGRFTLTDCFDATEGYFDVYEFVGSPGQTVTVDMSSTNGDPNLLLAPQDKPVVARDDNSGPGLDARIVYTLPSGGDWRIYAAKKNAGSADYTLRLSCSGGSGGSSGTCAEGPDTACLNNGRFRVRATYQTSTGASGQAQQVRLTNDSGYLWFFNAANVEALVKIVNGCGVNNRYWVFAGGLTNVRTVITVTDTKTGAAKTYTNPQGVPFQPIQDTNAFASCP